MGHNPHITSFVTNIKLLTAEHYFSIKLDYSLSTAQYMLITYLMYNK